MVRAKHWMLDRMGIEELEDWEQAKIFCPIFASAIITMIVMITWASLGNPYGFIPISIVACFGVLFLVFAVGTLLISRPIVIEKVNGVWVMKR